MASDVASDLAGIETLGRFRGASGIPFEAEIVARMGADAFAPRVVIAVTGTSATTGSARRPIHPDAPLRHGLVLPETLAPISS